MNTDTKSTHIPTTPGTTQDSTSRILLHLRIKTKDENRQALLNFLQEAVSFYEEPGGIKIYLYQSTIDQNSFIEVVEYIDHPTYENDQKRVSLDPNMKQYLDRWHLLLDGQVSVEVYKDISDQIQRKDTP